MSLPMSPSFKVPGARVHVSSGGKLQDRVMQRFSGFSLLRRGLSGQRGWRPQWRHAAPKPAYDALIVGGGGHGLGTAYYLASEHRLTNIAVLEKGWIGSGNTGRNTTIIRSNYLYDESAAMYEHALKLWEGLSQELNYNVMFSKRGVLMLAHNVHDVQSFQRHIHSNRLNGVDARDTTRRNEAGDDGHEADARGDGQQHPRADSRRFKEQGLHQPPDDDCAGQSDDQADGHGRETFSHHHAHQRRGRRAQREADRKFARPASDRKRRHAVDPEAGEHH